MMKILFLQILVAQAVWVGVEGFNCVLNPNLGAGGFFDSTSCADILARMGTNLAVSDAPEKEPEPVAIPDTYNWRTQYPSCTIAVRDQGSCGSCWAFSSTGALGDRFCQGKSSLGPVNLSPQDLVDCDRSCDGSRCQQGCDGGYQDLGWSFLKTRGVVYSSCVPYEGTQESCADTCASSSANHTELKGGDVYRLSGVENIQRDIILNGPVQAAYTVYKNFLDYTSGVYVVGSSPGESLGGHAVKIIGWGTEGGVAYWLVENSWSAGWGDQGFFKIRRGTNEASFESYVVASEAQVEAADADDNDKNENSSSSVVTSNVVALIATSLLTTLLML